MKRISGLISLALFALSACGGGGGGGTSSGPVPGANLGTPMATASPTPAPTATPVTSTAQNASVLLLQSGPQTQNYSIVGSTASVTFPTANTSTTLTTSYSSAAPSGAPALQSVRRHAASIGVTPTATIAYLCVTPTTNVTLSGFPSVSLRAPNAAGSMAYTAIFNPTAPEGWSLIAGPATAASATYALASSGSGPTLQSGVTYCFAYFTTSSAIATPAPPTLTSQNVPAWNASQHQGYVAVAYGGNVPQYISIYAPGQSVASATISYDACCLWSVKFDSLGNLYAATDSGIMEYAPGTTAAPTAMWSAQGGFVIATDAANDIAVGGYNMGSTIAVYPQASTAALYRLPGLPADLGIAFSPSGEIAVAQSDGTIQTFARGATTPNRTIVQNFNGNNGTNDAMLAYDGNGNLAAGIQDDTSVSVYAPGATSPTYTIASGISRASSLMFDSLNRLIVNDTYQVDIFAAGSATRSQTLTAATSSYAVESAVDAFGTIAVGGQSTGSVQIYQPNAIVTTLTNFNEPESVAISP